MGNQVAVAYTINPTGPSAAAVVAAMQNPPTLGGPGVPEPTALLVSMGLRVTADNTIGTARSLTIAFGPSVNATLVPVMVASDTSILGAINVTAPGIDYILPPVITWTGGGPKGANLVYGLGEPGDGSLYPAAITYLNVQGDAVVYPGSGYNVATTTAAFVGGLPPALFLNDQDTPGDQRVYPTPNGPPYAVNNVSLVKQGFGYSTSAIVVFENTTDFQPGGFPAQAVITGFGPQGQILGILVINPGQGYVTPPDIVIYDPVNGEAVAQLNQQAVAVPLMGAGTPATATPTIVGGAITGLAGLTPGAGYVQPPTVVIYDSAAIPGTGALVTARMGVGSALVTYPGFGLFTTPALVLTPYFKSLFPDLATVAASQASQSGPFFNFPLQFAIQKATSSQVVPAAPLVS